MISVIVPVYNCEKYIRKTIQSVKDQTFEDWELILVDDGSSDESGHICDMEAEKDDRIRVIHNENGGVSAARNTGIEKSKGDFICFLDSDDLLNKKALEKMYRNIAGIDLVAASFEDTTGVVCRLCSEEKTFMDIMGVPYVPLYENHFFNTVWGKLYRKDKIQEHFINGYNWGEDLLFNLCYMRECIGIRMLPDILYTYRVTNGPTLSRTCHKNAMNIRNEIFHEFLYCLGDTKKVKELASRDLIESMVNQCVFLAKSDTPYDKKIRIYRSWSAHFNKKTDLSAASTWKHKILMILLKYKAIHLLYAVCRRHPGF